MTFPLTPRLTVLALLTLPLAACDGVGLPGFGPEQPPVEAHRGPPTVSPTEAPIETGGAEARPVATAEARTHNTAAFSARGNEPFWAVDVAGNTAIYKTPSNQRGQAVRVNRLTYAEGVEYIGVLNGRPFVVNIRGTDCQDSMSGDRFPMSATLTVSGRSQTGCAAPAAPEVAQAVAATRAPAPAAPRAASRPAPAAPAATRPASNPEASTTEPAAAASTEETPETDKPTSDTAPATATTTPTPASPQADDTPATAPETDTPAAATDEAGTSGQTGNADSRDEDDSAAPATPAPAADIPAPTTTSPAVVPVPEADTGSVTDTNTDADTDASDSTTQ